ncbi:MAG: hypothetical protein RR359_01555 [Bacilli bacterium]
MNYILKNDFNSIKHVLLYSCVLYLIPLLLFRVITILTNFPVTNLLLENFFSYNIEINSTNWILTIISCINIIVYLMLIYVTIINDVKLGKANIFLRLDIKNWLLYKNISIAIIIIVYTIIRFIIISSLFSFLTINFHYLYIMFYQCIFFIFVSNLHLLSFIYCENKDVIFCTLFVIVVLLKIPFILLIVMLILTEIWLLKLLKLKRSHLLERRL